MTRHAHTAVLFLGLAVLAGGAVSADQADSFFDDSAVREVRLYFSDPDWYDTLYASHANDPDDPYFEASFRCGETVLPTIGARFKGNSSFWRNGVKKSFKLDFNEFVDDATFLGLKKLNLNNLDLQPDFMREKLFLDFVSRYMPAMRAVHVNVYVNDELWGLYLAVEQPDKTMMESRFGDDEDGNLFEAGEMNADLTYLGADPSLYYDLYELKTNETENDYSDLIELIDILNNTATADLPAALEPVCDVENMLYGIAVNILFSNLESYVGAASEYYLYDRDDTGQFVYVHWDCNETFGTTGDGTPVVADPMSLDLFYLPSGGGPPPVAGPGPAGPATSPAAGPALLEPPPPGGGERPLMEKLWAVGSYHQIYVQQVARMLREGFDIDTMRARIQELADLIRPSVYADSHKAFTADQFETALTSQVQSGQLTIYGLEQFVSGRYDYLRPILDTYALPSDVRLNEAMTVNDGVVLDPAGEADPWLELHNLGPGPVATTGLYLTDDTADPTKWVLPTATMEDGSFLLVWLDGEPGEGSDHATFGLQAGGGSLFLYSTSSGTPELVDSVTYPALAYGRVWIRLGQIGSRWDLSDQPTPWAANPAAGGVAAAGVEALRLNEIMADNDATVEDPDEPGAFEDWFEVANLGASEVDLSGLYLTDDLTNPTKWQVPAGVTVAAHGHLLFWADEDTDQGPNHAGFKLSAGGEDLGLVAADGVTVIDSTTFGAQTTDVAVGRFPDGYGALTVLDPPTPGAANSVAGLVFADGFELADASGWDALAP